MFRKIFVLYYIIFYYFFTINTIRITDICRNIRDAAHIKKIRNYGYPNNRQDIPWRNR